MALSCQVVSYFELQVGSCDYEIVSKDQNAYKLTLMGASN